MKRLRVALTAALCFLTGEALADGYTRQTPTAALQAPPSWTGFYLGAGVGAGAVVHDLSIAVPGVANVLSFDGIGGEGIFGTVIVGYDHQIHPGVVLGIFADYDFSDISTDLSVLNGLFSASLNHRHSWSIGGRLGLLLSPTTLWYGMAGYTQAQFDLASTVLIPGLNLSDFNGFFVGAGVESLLGGGWAVRAEYRFTQFDSETVFSIPRVLSVDLEPSMHTARIALTYKFGRRDEVRVPLK